MTTIDTTPPTRPSNVSSAEPTNRSSPLSGAKLGAWGKLMLELIVAQVAMALGNIDILGQHPLAFLTQWGKDLQQQASDAYAKAQGAQDTADDAQTTATTANGTANDIKTKLEQLIAGVPGAEQIEDVIDYLTSTNSVAAEVQKDLTSLADSIYNAITANNASGVSLGALGSELQKLAKNVETALTSAANSFDITQTFGGILHQVVEDLEAAPVYQGPLDFLEQMAVRLGTLWGNIVTSLSPQNPGTAQNTGQINAIWAHLNSGTSGIRMVFDDHTPLSANYPGTTNPAFVAPNNTSPIGGTYSLPTVVAGTSYLEGVFEGIGTFTGNPSALTNGDHGLSTDRVHAEMTVLDILAGAGGPFICGHGTTTMGQHVALELYLDSFSQTLSIVTYTAPGTGRVVRGTADLVAFLGRVVRINDVIAIEHDGAGTYAMYVNGGVINGNGKTWYDGTSAITHGPGYRECGVKIALSGQGNPEGPGLGALVAYDF